MELQDDDARGGDATPAVRRKEPEAGEDGGDDGREGLTGGKTPAFV